MASNKETQEALLKAAFRRFVELVEPIEDVYAVRAMEPRRPDIFTYIKQMDDEVETGVIHAQWTVADEFPEMLIDFHIVFLDGKSVEYFHHGPAEFVYSRNPVKQKESKRGISR